MNEKHIKVLNVALLMLLAFNIACLIWYVVSGYDALIHSDSAVKVLLANEIVMGGHFFPGDWNYVNGDLFILFGHVFIVPLLAFMRPGFNVHAVAGLLTSMLILLSIGLLGHQLKLSWTRLLSILVIFAAGLSGFAAENLYGQTAYGAVLFVTCLIIFLSLKILTEKYLNNKLMLLIGLSLIVLLAVWGNPLRALVSYVLPLFSALILTQFFPWSESRQRNIKTSSVQLMVVSAVLIFGIWLHKYTIADVNDISGVASARWLSYDGFLKNISFVWKGIFAIFGGLPPANESILGAWGIYFALRLIAAILLIGLIPGAISSLLRSNKVEYQFLAVYAITAFLIALFVQLFTSVPDMSDPVQSSRYLVPSLFLFVIIVFVSDLKIRAQFLKASILIFVFVMFGGAAIPVYSRSGLSSEPFLNRGSIRESRILLIDFMKNNSLEYGYAGYWSAGVMSVLSDGDTLVRQVNIENGIPMPMRHLSSNQWYTQKAWKGRTFLMLTDAESDLVDWQKMKLYGSEPISKLKSEGYNFYVFEDNLAKHLPGWSSDSQLDITYTASKESPRELGVFYGNYNLQGPAIIVEPPGKGAMHYGPYKKFEAGRYEVTFDVLADEANEPTVRLDVVAEPNQKVLGEVALSKIDAPYVMNIQLKKPMVLEFRVWALGKSVVAFHHIKVKKIQ